MIDTQLYIIIQNPRITYREIARVCVSSHISFLQLREKDLSDKDFIKAAESIMEETEGSDTKLVVNDRVHIASLVGAPAVHLGQSDMPLREAREMMPENTIFGLSTHNLNQLKEACLQKPAYAGFGPVYATTTKKNPDPVTGLTLLKQASLLSTLPLVAIGGIFPDQVSGILSANVSYICLVRHLMAAGSSEEFALLIEGLKKQMIPEKIGEKK